MIDKTELWIVIIGLGIGSFALRFAFTGLVGDRQLPIWLMRHLRYTAVGILPAIIAPAVLWPAATNGDFDIPRVSAAIVTLTLGLIWKNVVGSIIGGRGLAVADLDDDGDLDATPGGTRTVDLPVFEAPGLALGLPRGSVTSDLWC